MYPDRPGVAEQRCDRDGVQLANIENDVIVQFEARVPHHLLAVGMTVNGDVMANNLAGFVHGQSVNGDVILSTSSLASAESVSGSSEVHMGDPSVYLTPNDGLSFQTVNGSVSVTVPQQSSFEFEMSTLLGSIDAAFPHDMAGGRNAQGRAGAGGPFISLSSINGDTELLQSR